MNFYQRTKRGLSYLTPSEANGLELVEAPSFTIPYAGTAPDFGAYEYDVAVSSRMVVTSGETEQTVYIGTDISPITLA